MKQFNNFMLCCAFLMPIGIWAQPADEPSPHETACYIQRAGEEPIYTIVEQMPAFPGGEIAMFQYLWENLRYPSLARARKTQGTVYLCFVVSETGVLSHLMVKRGLPNGCSEEAVRLVQAMPNWNPGRQNGRRLKTHFTLPVRFALDEPMPKRTFDSIPASGERVLLKNVSFESDTSMLQFRPASYTVLSDLKDMLEKDTTLKIDIYGHYADTGDVVQKANRSKSYAKAVYDYLIRQGISRKRLSYYPQPFADAPIKGQKSTVSFRIPLKVVPYVLDSLKCAHATCQTHVSTYAAFSNDRKALGQYLDAHLKYPLHAKIEGTVYLAFIVAQDGSLQNIQVKRGIAGGLTEEAIRVVQDMPKWIPATKNGQKVCSKYTLPVKFKLD